MVTRTTTTITRRVRRRRPVRAVRRNRARRAVMSGPAKAIVPAGPPLQRQALPSRIRSIVSNHKMSDNGLAFLKCAFASPDFTVDPGKGIPDQFHGRTLSIKDCFTTAITFTPGTDTFIIIPPVPGYAYFKSEVLIGSDPVNFIGVTFPTYATNFGNGTDGQMNFSKFRYASIAAGLYPTSNLMQFSGSVQVWRTDLNLARTAQNSTATGFNEPSALSLRVQGLQSITTLAPRDNYSESFIKGAYTFGFDKSQDFEWEDFTSSTQYIQDSGATANKLQWDGTRRLTGLGNTNTLIFKVSTPVGAVNSAMLRVWNCIEMQPNTDSSLFQYSGVSPQHDPIAMEVYHNIKMRFPVAVPCGENAKFWETVLRVIQQVTKIGALLPGPFGVISGGIETAASGVLGLL